MDLKLKDKVVVITGGAGGVGRSLTEAFLEENAIVVSLDKNKEKGEEIEEQFKKKGKEICFIETDVSDQPSIDKAFDAIFKKFSTIDILVNNAGVFSCTPISDITADSWDAIMRMNVRSALLCTQKVLTIMKEKKYGKIINIASMGGETGGIYAGADYAISKAGMISLTKTSAKNLGEYGISVNCVSPGPLTTDMTKYWPPEVLEDLKKRTFVKEKRLGKPEEVASVVVFLASDRASFIQGAQIDINGGIFMR